MKIHRILPMRRLSTRAFTLIELLVVIAIIALLAALSIGAFSMATQTAARNRSTSTLQAIVGGLERYKEANGEFPAPSDTSNNHSLTFTSGAAMLYQAITGDGNDKINLANSTESKTQSQGKNADPKYVINGDFIPTLSDPSTGTWKSKLNATKVVGTGGAMESAYLIDGFGHPYQYDKAAATGQTPTTVNPTYDLWSYGNLSSSDAADGSLQTKSDSTKTSIWIKNW